MRRRSDYRKERAPSSEGDPMVLGAELRSRLGSPFAAYLAPAGFQAELSDELGDVFAHHGRLLLAPGPARSPAWAENVWQEPLLLTVGSIKDAVRQLKAIQRNWAAYAVHLHRRTALVSEQLPHVSARPLEFPQAPPPASLGSWTFLDAETVLASPSCSSPFPNGEARFVEDKENPPSRAYLKLWEALVRFGRMPGPGERCLDLGASPGGWTWVLATLGADVVAVDKAPLEGRVASLENVEVRQESAFGLAPQQLEEVSWLCSDIICYPQRLCDLVERWQRESRVEHMICTVKFQGATDFEAIQRLRDIPGSSIVHLFNNKHELTYFWSRPPSVIG